MQSAKERSFAGVPVGSPESGGGARSPFQAETCDRDDAGAVDSDHVQHHERHRGQNASTVSHRKIAEEAEREYRAALKENSQDEKSILRLAEIDAEKGNTRQFYDEYTKAVALRPGDADAKLGLAKALTEMNQTDKAQKLLEEAVQL